ncbi:MAG: benzoate-CoA ligase family protein [Pseudomonadota bacterium]
MNDIPKNDYFNTTAIKDPVSDTPGAKRFGFDKSRHCNASEILFQNLSRNPDLIAVTGPTETLTYAELCAEAAQWGNAFSAAGLKRGDRISMLLDDTPRYPSAVMGAIRAGFVPVLLNTQTRPDLLNYYLSDSSSPMVVVEATFADAITQEAIDGTKIDKVVIANSDSGSEIGENIDTISSSDFISEHSVKLDAVDTGPEDMAFWMYSSGSTGKPKGIVHLQHDMAYTAETYAASILKLQPGDRCFSVPKIFFAYGFGNAITFPFAVGASVVLLPGRPDPKRILTAIEEYKPTAFFALPTVYTALAHAEETASTDFSSLRLSLSAAEILSEDVFNAWRDASGLEAIEGLGSTEMLHIYLSNTAEEKRLGSAGKVVAGYEVKLCDQDGAEVTAGEDGVMWVRGHSSAPLYWNRPDKTAETMREDWIYTGDRFIEADGFYYFQGRADDLVKVSGQWVWPLEVERCLNENEAVQEAAVLAHALEDRRTVLRAVVALCEGVEGDDDTRLHLREHIKHHLLPFKAPRIIEFVPELPKTGTGKIDRQVLVNNNEEKG